MVTRAQPSRVVRKRAEDPARLVGRARRSLSAQLVPARFRFWYSLCVEPSRRGFRTTMISAAVRSLSRVPIPLRGLAVCVRSEERRVGKECRLRSLLSHEVTEVGEDTL